MRAKKIVSSDASCYETADVDFLLRGRLTMLWTFQVNTMIGMADGCTDN